MSSVLERDSLSEEVLSGAQSSLVLSLVQQELDSAASCKLKS